MTNSTLITWDKYNGVVQTLIDIQSGKGLKMKSKMQKGIDKKPQTGSAEESCLC